MKNVLDDVAENFAKIMLSVQTQAKEMRIDLNNLPEEERLDFMMQDLADSKTSAPFAYVAVQRNCRALLALVKRKPLIEWRDEHLKLAKLSLRVSALIKEEFFPLEDLIYEEFGCDDF